MAKLEKLMEQKKNGKELDPEYKRAKMSMLDALRSEMAGMMRDDLSNHSMKKVQVASDSKEGLASGLDKAKEMLSADHGSNEDQLGQDEADEHGIESDDMYDVSPEMEESAEEGDSMEPEHEGEMDQKLSPEEELLLKKLLAKKGL